MEKSIKEQIENVINWLEWRLEDVEERKERWDGTDTMYGYTERNASDVYFGKADSFRDVLTELKRITEYTPGAKKEGFFYTSCKDFLGKEFIKSVKARRIKIKKHKYVDAIIHFNNFSSVRNYVISERRTGKIIANGSSVREAYNLAKSKIKTISKEEYLKGIKKYPVLNN